MSGTIAVTPVRDGEGNLTHAVVPWPAFVALLERAGIPLPDFAVPTDEDLFAEALADGDEESFPLAVGERLVDGESPVKVFREHRGLTQAQLAAAAGTSAAYISQIERGDRNAGRGLLARIATALAVDLDHFTG